MKHVIIIALLAIFLSGCALERSYRDTGTHDPREKASLQLTREGKEFLGEGQPDNAIRLFEQALGLNPNNGQCYYYLAEAWLMKGVHSEAKAFNSLALDYFKGDRNWTNRVLKQERRIDMLGD